jgi:hypothetical protein
MDFPTRTIFLIAWVLTCPHMHFRGPQTDKICGTRNGGYRRLAAEHFENLGPSDRGMVGDDVRRPIDALYAVNSECRV